MLQDDGISETSDFHYNGKATGALPDGRPAGEPLSPALTLHTAQK